jgi:hypothetical protein
MRPIKVETEMPLKVEIEMPPGACLLIALGARCPLIYGSPDLP